jgi:hypothetical protein
MTTPMAAGTGGEFAMWAASRTVAMHREGDRRCKQCRPDGSCRLLAQAQQILAGLSGVDEAVAR